MSTLRISNIEAKADSSSPTVDEQLKFTNSDGDVLLHLDGRTAGITTVGINTTNQTIKFDANNNILITGIVTATEFHGSLAVGTSVTYGDNEKAYFGNGLDMSLYHDGTNSYLKNNTNNFNINTTGSFVVASNAGSNVGLVVNPSGATSIRYANSVKLATTNTGAVVTGILTATGNLHADNAFLNSGLTLNNNANVSVNLTSTSTSGSSRIFFGDPDNSLVGRLLYSHNGDYMSFYTAGAERLRITSAGDVGINVTPISGVKLQVGTPGSATGVFRAHPDYFSIDSGYSYGGGGSGAVGSASNPSLIFGGDGNTGLYHSASDTLNFTTGGTERLRIDSSGRVLVNTTTTNNGNNKMIIEGPSPSGTYAPYDGQLVLKNSETSGAINTGSALVFFGHDGGNQRGSGAIRCLKENGTSGNHDFYMSFLTRVNGGSNSEKLRITSAGSVGINESSPDRKLHVRSDGAAAAKLGGESGAAYYMEIGQLASSGSPGFNATGSSTSMLFQLNGSEKVRIDSSGRLLVATNSASAANSGADDLVIGNTGQGNNGMTIVTNNANIGGIFFADQDNTVRGGVRYQHASDLAQFYAGGNVVLNLKNKGVGINETSPTEDALVIRGGDTDDTPSLILKRHTDGVQGDGEVIGRIQFMSNENNVDSGNHHTRAEIRAETQSTSGASRLEFYTVPNSTIATALAATINGTQDFMIGTQNPDEGGAGLGFNARGFVYRPSGHAVVRSASTSISGASGICYTAKFADTGTGKAFRVMLAQTEIGSIGMGAGGTTFNTSSDYRRKENIINLTDAITRLKTLTPKRFNFKDEPSVTRDGFLAHEVTAVPEAITGTKDQVDSNNDPVYQQMDQSKLVPLLVAALQEAVARIEALEGS